MLDRNGWTGARCPDCKGTGEAHDARLDRDGPCKACGGTGDENVDVTPCPGCRGKGYQPGDPEGATIEGCDDCGGAGVVRA